MRSRCQPTDAPNPSSVWKRVFGSRRTVAGTTGPASASSAPRAPGSRLMQAVIASATRPGTAQRRGFFMLSRTGPPLTSDRCGHKPKTARWPAATRSAGRIRDTLRRRGATLRGMLRPGRSLGWPSTLLGACLVLACSGSEKNPAAPSVNTGGTQAGGMQNESGASSEGGISGTASGGTGGATASGGRGGRGGASQGGKSAMGGAAPTGGADANGGMSATGGAGPTGGSGPNGGAGPTGGASPSGGISATGGAGPDDESDAGGRSDGCGQASPASGEFEQRELEVERETRIFHLLVPDSYDPDRAYPLVFRFHGSGGDGLSGGLGIEFSSREDAIIVAPNGLNNSWSPRNHDTDVAFFDAMLETIADEYCIDLGRVYSYGFSAGGSFTNLLGCVRGNALRATASIASAYREGSCQ